MMFDNDFPYQGDSRFRDFLYRREIPHNDFPYQGNPRLRDFLDRREKPRFQNFLNRNEDSASGYLQQYVKGMQDYSQAGTDIPDFRVQDQYAQEQGGPLINETTVSKTPSFETLPDIDSPVIDRDINQYRQQFGPSKLDMNQLNQNIQRLRQIIRGATKFDTPSNFNSLMAANQGPSTPVKYDESMGGYVPNQGATRPANIRYKGFPGGA
jgi:hypothetical protein